MDEQKETRYTCRRNNIKSENKSNLDQEGNGDNESNYQIQVWNNNTSDENNQSQHILKNRSNNNEIEEEDEVSDSNVVELILIHKAPPEPNDLRPEKLFGENINIYIV